MNYLLGIDAGTTAFKAALFDEAGKALAVMSDSYSLILPSPSMVEFVVDEYWGICSKLVKKLIKQAGVKSQEIKALAISSQGETLICVDENGKPLRNAIVWLDNRSDREASIIRERFGIKEVFEKTGQPEVVATWTATKILWLKENEPDIFKNTKKFLLLEDYLIYKFTGKYAAEKSLLCSSLLFDIHRGEWWGEMLDFIGIESRRLPEVMESGVPVGKLTEEASEATGLSRDTVAVTGTLDQTAGIIGAGNIKPGVVTETTGSCLAVCVNIDKPVEYNPNVKVTCQYHAIQGKYFLLFWSQTAGIVLKWFKENFYGAEEESCSMQNRDIFKMMDDQAGLIPAGAESLIMLPHLSGTASPEFNPYASGVFFGITLKHTKPHFVRAVMEAVAYMLNSNIKIMEDLGVDINEIYSLGGGAKSKLWNAIKSDVTGKAILTIKNEETACLGAAILAGVGAGVFSSVEDACSNMVEITERFEPDENNFKVYEKAYGTYLKLYQSLKGMFVEQNLNGGIVNA